MAKIDQIGNSNILHISEKDKSRTDFSHFAKCFFGSGDSRDSSMKRSLEDGGKPGVQSPALSQATEELYHLGSTPSSVKWASYSLTLLG